MKVEIDEDSADRVVVASLRRTMKLAKESAQERSMLVNSEYYNELVTAIKTVLRHYT